MLPRTQVRTLVRELSATKVLSVYLDTHVTNPAMRDAWRTALTAALRDAGASLSNDDHAEFQRAAAHLERTALPESGVWAAPGWMAFATAEGVRLVNELPLRTPTMAVWREGPVIAPYLRALKQHHPVIVALVDSRSATLYRVRGLPCTAWPRRSAPFEGARVEVLSGEAAEKLDRVAGGIAGQLRHLLEPDPLPAA